MQPHESTAGIHLLTYIGDISELLEAVKASLRAKVAALAEDNWMYEKEDEPRVL